KKKRRWLLAVGGIGFTLYAASKLLQNSSSSVRHSFSRILGALDSLTEAVSDSADAIGTISKDLNSFLGSDSDHVPQSLKQVSKLASSDEFHDSLSRITAAVTAGVYRGCRNESARSGGASFSDKLFSDEGRGFASAIVGSFSRNAVMSLYSEWWRHGHRESDSVQKWVQIAGEDTSRELIGDMIRTLVSTAVTAYLDKTMDTNPFDDLFSGLTNPKHEAGVRELLASLCNAAVEAYIRTRNDVSKEANKALRRGHRNLVTFGTTRSLVEFMHQKVVDKGAEAMRRAAEKSCAVAALCLTLCLCVVDSPWSFVPT
ncbi:hypothetical protein M569_04880, partial [Genlisea aurea]